jgi:hypothetical protein
MKPALFWIMAALTTLLFCSCSPRSVSSPQENNGVTPPMMSASAAPGSASMDLSVNSLNATPPADIRDEVLYFGGLGGGVDCTTQNYQTPTGVLAIDADKLHPAETILVYACGLPVVGENVGIKVELPDNTITESSQIAQQSIRGSVGEVSLEYHVKLNAPIGTYHFVFQGAGWSLDQSIVVHEITHPSLILDNNQLIFLKFQQHEKIRVFVYMPHGAQNARLLGWQEVQADEKGQLRMTTDSTNGLYVAIGDLSGEVDFLNADGQVGWSGSSISK